MPTLKSKSWQRLCLSVMAAAVLSTAVNTSAQTTIDSLYDKIQTQYRLTQTQAYNLLLVNQYAVVSGHPEVLQALMIKESRAGMNTKSNGNCHGVMQIMTSSAIGVLRLDAEFRQKNFGVNKPTPKLVAAKLKSDVVFSIEVADRILASSLEKTTDINRAVMAYNRGERSLQGNANPMKLEYVRDIDRTVKLTTGPITKLFQQSQEENEETSQSI